MTDVLMADDDREFCALVQEYLRGHDFDVTCVHDGGAVLPALERRPALLILDVMMPVKDGFEVLSELRRVSSIPVLMLTARGEDVDRIVGLEMGADDYLAKPCNPRELAARLKAILRRSDGGGSGGSLRAGNLTLDLARREARVNDRVINLTGMEFEVLAVLAASAGEIVGRDPLSQKALGRRWHPEDRSLDMHIVNLRRKLGDERIKTIRGRGYQLIA